MAKILILEDDPARMTIFRATLGERHDIVHSEVAADFIKLLDTIDADAIFLDHDLGGQQMVDTADKNTGSEVVRYLVSTHPVSCTIPIIIHSGNSVAAKRMQEDLERAGYHHVFVIPFPMLSQKYLRDPGFIV